MKNDNCSLIKPSLRKRQKRRDKRMHEELIECYRAGNMTGKRKGYKKKLAQTIHENQSNKEGIKLMKSNSKDLTDNLGPLKRFLEVKKGQYWDKVYSELCQKMDKRPVIGLHLFDHLSSYVCTDAFIVNGKVYSMSWQAGERELVSTPFWPRYYVHPKSGVLVKVKKQSKYLFN